MNEHVVAPALTVAHGDQAFLRESALATDRVASCKRVKDRTEAALAATNTGLDLSEACLSGLDLSGFDLRHANLNRALLHGTKLDGASLRGASLICPGTERTSFRGADLSNSYLHAIALQVCNLDHADLSHVVDCTGSLLHGCSCVGTKFDESVMAGATFYQCNLTKVSFCGAELQGATINECNLHGANFSGSHLDQVTITKCSIADTSFSGSLGSGLTVQRPTRASGLSFEGARLAGLRLDGVRGSRWQGRGLDAADIDISHCQLAEIDLTDANLKGIRIIDSSLTEANFSRGDLSAGAIRRSTIERACFAASSGENLSIVESSLRGSNFTGFRARAIVVRDSDLSESVMNGAYFYRAMMTGDPPRAMSLRNVDFTEANLVQAYIAADLEGAKLDRARLSYVRMNQSILDGIDMRGLNLFGASFIKVSMRGVVLNCLDGPLFADRCDGLEAAVSAIEDQCNREHARRMLEAPKIPLRRGTGST